MPEHNILNFNYLTMDVSLENKWKKNIRKTTTTMGTKMDLLKQISEDEALLEIGRKAVEEVLVDWRDSRMSVLRNNGLVIKERDGKTSDIIRMGPEDCLRIGLKAIIEHLEEHGRS